MPRGKQTAISTETREALILAGERLFAEHGIDAVSLRQINTGAGQRNSSAAHYHFGSKEALIKAIHSYRLERVNHRRCARLETLKAASNENDVRSVVETIVYPIVEEIHETDGGPSYIRFLAQLIGHPQFNVVDLWSEPHVEGLSRALQLLKKALPEVPDELIGQRFGLMWEQTIHALSDRENLRKLARNRDTVDLVVFVSNLVDTVAGGLAAPVSGATKRELAAAKIRNRTTS